MSLWGRLASALSIDKSKTPSNNHETADTDRSGLSPIDLLNFGLVQPYIRKAYEYHENCSLLCDIDVTLTQDAFRNGIAIEPKFVLKCRQCGHELQEKADKCPSCASDQLDPPMWAQQRFFEHLDGTSFLERANYSEQTLEDVLVNAMHHLHVADNAYLCAVQTYTFNEDGTVKDSFVKEIVSLDPRWVEKVFDSRGRPGGRHRLCLAHRTNLLGPEVMTCPEPGCGKPTHDVTYKVTSATNGISYWVDDEIVHLTEFYPHPLYGTPPCYKIRLLVTAYMHCEGKVCAFFEKGRAPGFIAVKSNNPKAIDEQIQKTNKQLEKDPWATPYFPVPYGPGEGSGEFIKFVKLMDDPTKDMMGVKDELRRGICSFFMIPPMVESDTAASGGLNNEDRQITLFNRRVKRDQAPFNNKAFPWLFRLFHITDLKLVMQESEKNDEKLDLEIQILRNQDAQGRLALGFQIEGIEDGEYKFSEKPDEVKQPPMFSPPPQSGHASEGEPVGGAPSGGPPSHTPQLVPHAAELLGNKEDCPDCRIGYSDKKDCPPGWHSHPDYENGRCHPESQQHRDGEHHEEGAGQRGPPQNPPSDEERKAAALKRIASRGVKVEEIEPAHPAVLEHLDTILEEATKYGAPLPDIIEINSGYLPEGANIEEEHGQFGVDDQTGKAILFINPRSKIFRNNMAEAEQAMKDYFEEKWCSTDNPLHAIRHELSHLAHWKHDPESFKKEKFDHPSDMVLAHDRVSEYASKDPAEFVAEVRAALLNGKKFGDGKDDFPEEIKALYLHYSGGLTK